MGKKAEAIRYAENSRGLNDPGWQIAQACEAILLSSGMAEDAGLFDLAIELVETSPTDPRTLTRAARDFADKQPMFALEAALAALRWIAAGHGYEITGLDVLDAHDALINAAAKAGMNTTQLNELLNNQLDSRLPNSDFIRKVLAHRL